MKNPRVLLAGAVILVAVAVGVVVLVAGGSGDDGDEPRRTARAKLKLERFVSPTTRRPELLISLPQKRLNTPETTGGEASVLLQCRTASGAIAVRGPTTWPLQEEPGYPLPHIHQNLSPKEIAAVRSCRVSGPGLELAGSVPGRPPRAAQ